MTAGSSALILVLVSAVLSVASYNIVHTRLKKSRLKTQVTAHFESVGDLASPSTTVDTQVLDAAAANVVLRATATALQGLVPSANDEDEDEIQVDDEFPRSAASASEENPLYRSSGSASIPDQRQPPESVRANRQSRGVPVGQSNSGHTGIFQSQKGQSPVSKGTTTTVRKLPTVTVPPSRKKVQQRTYDLSTTEALARHKRGMAGEQGSRVSDPDFVRLDTHDVPSVH